MNGLMRADAALRARGLADSRQRAQALIEQGLATVNGRIIAKSSEKVGPEDALAVLGTDHPWVGRGGLKLEKALKSFQIDPAGRVCMDIGASTGGFTDVLLQNGASRVYAIDVGAGQLAPRLASDDRVVVMEHTNARALTAEMFPAKPTLAVMDVSFISIRLILPAALKVLGGEGRMVSLVKPQFEVGRSGVGKGGIVSDPRAHIAVLREITDFVPSLGWYLRAVDFSPITGGDGNLEFLADLMPGCGENVTLEVISRVVAQAHAALSGVTKRSS